MTTTDITGEFAAVTATADDIATRIDQMPFLPFHWRIAGMFGDRNAVRCVRLARASARR